MTYGNDVWYSIYNDKRREDDMESAINETLAMYEDACGLEAVAAWDDDERKQEEATMAWNQYDGARSILASLFGITEGQVDDDMESLMYFKVFAQEGEDDGRD